MNYHQVTINSKARIARNATILGDVTIEAHCTILFNVSIRGDNSPIVIGARSNVQENSCLHVGNESSCLIGKDVTIGHNAVIHGCTIEDGSLIGMGAIIMDGAHIGKKCLVGAGALVTSNTKIPDGMLVIGSPAKAKRLLNNEEYESLLEASKEYFEFGATMSELGILATGAELPSDETALYQ